MSVLLLAALALAGCNFGGSSHGGSSSSASQRTASAASVTSTTSTTSTNTISAPGTANGHHFVGPKKYFMALGDSLAFGYQPNFNYNNGYPQEWYGTDLRGKRGVGTEQNFSCSGETTQTFIHGGCPHKHLRHVTYSGSQLSKALSYLHQHAGQVSPVALDIGADDMLPLINPNNCKVKGNFDQKLGVVDKDLTQTILPKLKKAMSNSAGKWTGDLIMMNYYDPYQNKCPNEVNLVQRFNQHLENDAAQFNVPMVDVFALFGGPQTPNSKICNLTWMCSKLHAAVHYMPGYKAGIHPQTKGYKVIANGFQQLAGY